MTDKAKRDDDARAAIVADLQKRLRPVCSQWPEELFDKMIKSLADITLRYEDRMTTDTYEGGATDRLVDDLKAALERSEHRRDSAPGHVPEANGPGS